MLIAIVIIFSLLIFPIFIRFEGEIDKKTQNLRYRVKLFKILPILFGYAEIIDEGIAVHVNNIKAFIIYYKDFFSIRKKIEPLKDYHFYKFNSTIYIGSKDNYDLVLTISIIYNAIINLIGFAFTNVKPYLKIKNDINLYNDKNEFILNVNFVIVLNLLMIALSFIKIILEKFIYAVKKQPN